MFLGILSLLLGLLVIFAPAAVVAILMYVVAIVIMLIGVSMIIDALGLRNAMKQLNIQELISSELSKLERGP